MKSWRIEVACDDGSVAHVLAALEALDSVQSVSLLSQHVTGWVAYVNEEITICGSEADAWETIRANYASELPKGASPLEIATTLDSQGIHYYVEPQTFTVSEA